MNFFRGNLVMRNVQVYQTGQGHSGAGNDWGEKAHTGRLISGSIFEWSVEGQASKLIMGQIKCRQLWKGKDIFWDRRQYVVGEIQDRQRSQIRKRVWNQSQLVLV